jgi:hypothetical protein
VLATKDGSGAAFCSRRQRRRDRHSDRVVTTQDACGEPMVAVLDRPPPRISTGYELDEHWIIPAILDEPLDPTYVIERREWRVDRNSNSPARSRSRSAIRRAYLDVKLLFMRYGSPVSATVMCHYQRTISHRALDEIVNRW